MKNIINNSHNIKYWKNNAEENYITTPINVLKYITCLETALSESKNVDLNLKQLLVDFACKVYDENYKKDKSFKATAESLVDKFI